MKLNLNNAEEMKRSNKFAKWFLENHEKNGGLIIKETAAQILDVSHSYIYNLIRDGKLKTYKFENNKTEYVAINDISRIKVKQISKEKE